MTTFDYFMDRIGEDFNSIGNTINSIANDWERDYQQSQQAMFNADFARAQCDTRAHPDMSMSYDSRAIDDVERFLQWT